jgi:hypothetical protein
MQTLDERLERIDEVRGEIANLTKELKDLVGLGDMDIVAAPVGRGKKGKKNRSTCSICGESGHNVATCAKGKGMHPNNPRENKSAGKLSNGRMPRGVAKPCCGSKGSRHMKTCRQYRGSDFGLQADPSIETPKPSRELSSEEYGDLRDAMNDMEFQSIPYALTHKLSPKEVNKAVRSSSYEEYIDVLD